MIVILSNGLAFPAGVSHTPFTRPDSHPGGLMPPLSLPPGDPPALLYCAVCGWAVRCPPALLRDSVESTWPLCCGEVMSLYLHADGRPGGGVVGEGGMAPIFHWSGEFFGFLTPVGVLFDADGGYAGWVTGGYRVWSPDGSYLGEITGAHYVLRAMAHTPPPPLPPLPDPTRPLGFPPRPPDRPPQPPRRGYTDALGWAGAPAPV